MESRMEQSYLWLMSNLLQAAVRETESLVEGGISCNLKQKTYSFELVVVDLVFRNRRTLVLVEGPNTRWYIEAEPTHGLGCLSACFRCCIVDACKQLIQRIS